MEELIKLITEYENLLSMLAPPKKSSCIMYRGDNISPEDVTKNKGFLPKKNTKDIPDYYNVIKHCIENSYGGPFISITSSKDIASSFSKSVYTIEKDIEIIDFELLVDNLEKILDEIQTQINKLDTSLKSSNEYMKYNNLYQQYKKDLCTAKKYHKAQKEELVPNKIDLCFIHLKE